MSTEWRSTIDLAGVERAIITGAERAVLLGTEHVLGESDKVVPLEEGTLSRSGTASQESHVGQVVGSISYDTPYAVVQHERMDLRHDEGRTAKYLEGPLVAEAPTVAAITAEQVKRALR